MQTLIQNEATQKITTLDCFTSQVKVESNNSKFDLGFQLYQKLFVIIFTSCAFLIFPESPQDSELLCKKYHSPDACIVW